MAIELRPITDDEFIPFMTSLVSNFGGTPKPERMEVGKAGLEFDRSLAAFDGTRIVATTSIDSYTMTLPGLTTTPTAGVTRVTVAPTHRRRGILRSMMARQLDDVAERGEAVAILYASESVIYGRFGYGASTMHVVLETDKSYSAFGRHPEITGSVDLITPESAAEALPSIYGRTALQRPGCVSRREQWWKDFLQDHEFWRDGASDRRYAVYTSGKGEADGYAAYRVKADWEDAGFPNGKLFVTDFVTVTPEARAALWQYCLGVDLVRTVTIYNTTLDDPLRWMMADPRRLQVKHASDGLWTRLVDIPSALSARRYATDDQLVFEVEDTFRPQTSGRYALEGGPEGATCRRVRRKPDLSMYVSDLGAVYLGGTPFGPLARAGRITEHTSGALRRADLMFSSDPLPWGSTEF